MKQCLKAGSEATQVSSMLASARAAALRQTCVRARKRRHAGFTLIELMIVVAIIAILAAIAYPAYTTYITKTHRVAAEGCLSEYANYMERYYTTNLNYKTAPDGTANPLSTSPPTLTLDCAGTQQTGDNYSYTLASATSTAYKVTATPIGTQLARDTTCSALSIDQTGTRTAGATTGCW